MRQRLIETDGTLARLAPGLTEEVGAPSKWVADVWRLGVKNLNGRVYPAELGERIAREGRSTLCYDGHESNLQSGLEYGNTVAVAKNPRVEGDRLVVDVEFIDKGFEEKLIRIAGQGVPVGVSSVGIGDVEGDGTVVPESYELVRYLDFVTAPAGEVWLRKEEEGQPGEPAGQGETAVASGLSAERKERISGLFIKHIGALK